MTQEEKLNLLIETFELENGELTPETSLTELECWDSMAKLSSIVLFDDEFDKKLTGEQIKDFKRIQDILNQMN